MAEVNDPLRALPVFLTVSHAHDSSVRRFVDGVLGWQPVGAEGGPMRARLHVTDDPSRIVSGVPTVLLVDDAGVPALLAKQLVKMPGVAVCLWPSERDALAGIATAALSQFAGEPVGHMFSVGGASGGVGTTTVALCVAGMLAWNGSSTLVTVNDWSSRAKAVPRQALSDPALWDRATPVAGVDRCRMIRVVDGTDAQAVADSRVIHHVYDTGVTHDVDLLVMRRDRAGLAALGQTTASIVVVVGDGVVTPSQVRDAAGSRRVIPLPHSVRVARAVASERVPAGVPGRWLASLDVLVRTVAQGHSG